MEMYPQLVTLRYTDQSDQHVGMHKRHIQLQLYYSIVETSGNLRHPILHRHNVRIRYQFQMQQGHGQERLDLYVLIKLLPEMMIAALVHFQKRSIMKAMKWDRH